MPLTRPDHPRKVVEDQQAAGEDTDTVEASVRFIAQQPRHGHLVR
jgi:hypothetical protein